MFLFYGTGQGSEHSSSHSHGVVEKMAIYTIILAGGFKHFLFLSLPGEMIPFD